MGGHKPDVGLMESGWCGCLGREKSTETRCTINRVGGWGGGCDKPDVGLLES